MELEPVEVAATLMMAPAETSEAPTNVSTAASPGVVDAGEEKEVSSADLYVFLSLMAVFCVTGVVGNSLMLAVFVRRLRRSASGGGGRGIQQYGQQYNYFTAALALADLLVCLVVLPYKAAYRARLIFDADACKAMQYVSGVSIIFSMLVLVGIAVERYYAVCRPWRPFTGRHAWAIIGSIAVLALCGSSPNYLTASVTAPDGRLVGCHFTSGTRPGRTYAATLFVLFVGTLVVTSVLYGVVFRQIYPRASRAGSNVAAGGSAGGKVVHQQLTSDSRSTGTQCSDLDAELQLNVETLRQDTSGEAESKPAASMNAANSSHRSRSTTRVVWMLFGVTFVFLISWVPYWLTNLRVVPYSLTFKHLYYVNNCMNFVVYGVCSIKLRQEMINCLRCR